MVDGSIEDMYGSSVWMELAPSVECKWKRKREWMGKWNWKAIHGRKMKGGLKHLVTWMVSLDIFFFFLFYFQGIFIIFS